MLIQKNSSKTFIDNYGRTMNYLCLAVTDRCNLRCQYCMPEEGVVYQPKENILSWEEMLRLCLIMTERGVEKIRITGGEPFVRKGLVHFLDRLKKKSPEIEVAITTNGVLIAPCLEPLKKAGITSLNISLDSLDPENFHTITRRNKFSETWESIIEAISLGLKIKLNMVIQPGVNDHEIVNFAGLTKSLPITVRFIEPMPFSGSSYEGHNVFTFDNIKAALSQTYKLIANGTSDSKIANRFSIPGHKGEIGIINAYSRTFCASCSRMRVSAQGQMRTCLYGENVLDLRELLRSKCSDDVIANAIQAVLNKRYKDGFEAEKNRQKQQFESMSAIGG